MRDVSTALQRAIYSALKTVANGAVYDRVPQDRKPPFVKIGDDNIVIDNDATELYDCTATIYVVATTKKEVKAIADEVFVALDKQLPVVSFITIEGWVELAVFRSQADGTELATLDFHYLLLRT